MSGEWAGVVKLKILKCEDYSKLSRYNLYNHSGEYKKATGEKLEEKGK